MHRAVALCYIPNPHNYPQVNHKDENKTNNNVDNLEWCDNKYNSHYSHAKAVLMLDKKTGDVIKRFEALRDVDMYLGKMHINLLVNVVTIRQDTIVLMGINGNLRIHWSK